MNLRSLKLETLLLSLNEPGAEQGVLVVRLHRPQALNGFTHQMTGELCDVFMAADADPEVRCIILSATGPKFCVGMDMAALSDGLGLEEGTGYDDSRQYRDLAGRVTVTMLSCRKPVIAAMTGDAVGVGITMCLAADLRFCVASASIGFVFVRRGLVPEGLSSFLLPRLVGMGKAQEWCLTGAVFKAKDEANSGLFNAVLPSTEEVMQRALAAANSICTKCSPTQVVLTRALLWNSMRWTNPESAHDVESQLLHHCFTSADFQEGVTSFMQRRAPAFPPLSALPPAYPWWTIPNVQPRNITKVQHPGRSKL